LLGAVCFGELRRPRPKSQKDYIVDQARLGFDIYKWARTSVGQQFVDHRKADGPVTDCSGDCGGEGIGNER
jgi:hypothetical protein